MARTPITEMTTPEGMLTPRGRIVITESRTVEVGPDGDDRLGVVEQAAMTLSRELRTEEHFAEVQVITTCDGLKFVTTFKWEDA